MVDRLVRASDPVLSLEIWLGPMEGLRHLESVPGSGDAVVRIGRRRADEKRGLENQFVLSEGEGISSFHAELRYASGKLLLKDLKSTNGSFVRNKPVIGEVPVEPGEIFLLSTTPVRVELVAEPRTEIAASERSLAELEESPLSAPLRQARESARRRGEAFLDTRHLAEGILRCEDGIVAAALSKSKTSRDEAIAALWQGGLYRGSVSWLQRFLSTPLESRGAPEAMPLSPRARMLASGAASRLMTYPVPEAERIAAAALLASLLASADGPVGRWLYDQGVRVELPAPPRRSAARKTVVAAPVRSPRPARAEEDTVAATRLRREASAARAAAPPPPETPAAPPPAPREKKPAAQGRTEQVFASTGDVVLDQRARAIALELEEAATLYRFSTPEDRRSVLKTLVNRSLAAIAPENRTRILSQIRVQFPVVGAPPPEEADEASRLIQRVQDLEQRLARAKAEKPSAAPAEPARPAGPVPWKTLLGPQNPGEVAPGEAPDLPALHALVTFARHMEKFLLGIVQGVTMPGDSTMSFRMPGHRHTLEGLLSALEQGKPVDPKTLWEYLRELERWQVAILAAHHESARLWFDKLWKRASPAAIEASTAKGGTWKIRGEATEWWSRYKETVKGLNPDVVQDQVLQTTFRLAQEEFDKLSKRRPS